MIISMNKSLILINKTCNSTKKSVVVFTGFSPTLRSPTLNHYSRPGTFPGTFVQKLKLQIHSIYDQTEFKNENMNVKHCKLIIPFIHS